MIINKQLVGILFILLILNSHAEEERIPFEAEVGRYTLFHVD